MFERISFVSVKNAGGTWSHAGFMDMGEATQAAEAAGEDASNQEVRLHVYPHCTRKWNPAESVAASKAHSEIAAEQIKQGKEAEVKAAKAKLDAAQKALEKAQAAHDALAPANAEGGVGSEELKPEGEGAAAAPESAAPAETSTEEKSAAEQIPAGEETAADGVEAITAEENPASTDAEAPKPRRKKK